ncbi:MAG TPA: glycoside hydrolase family 3 N-terminal domain-containing protein [Thermomicrobiales bacterium]|nr:glycoside hydrolase family 3 N-terminal domain-containing protein [Thermomicrobiales bacterium]
MRGSASTMRAAREGGQMEGRRAFLKRLAALGLAAPLSGVFGKTQRAFARPLDGAPVLRAQAAPSSPQLAGQRVIYSYPGLTVPDALLRAIAAGQAAGVIFFGENIAGADQLAAVVRQLRQAQERSPVGQPLLLMTDQEGGPVRRLSGAPEQSARQIGQAADPAAAAAAAGAAAGQNLAGAGLNVNLAPVLGVYRQAGDFLDQYERSFSRDPATVAACGRAFIAAQQRAGVAATAKHFPGLGAAAAAQNTDAVPVTLPVPLDILRAVDEAPYPAAIAAGVELIMLSWAVYPALDAGAPAGLSAAVVRDELRGRFGYRGVTITDALEAGALGAYGDAGRRAVLAARAGMDLILCSARDVGQGQAATAALADALDRGELAAADFAAAVQRVTALRGGLAPTRYFPETGHTLSHGFLAYWEQFGGLPVFGYPLTDEYTDPGTGLVTQYLERARFEWHPGAWPSRYDVELGQLGRELAQRQGLLGTPPFQRIEAATDAHCTYFPETGHRLCFGFRDYWQAHGGLPIFGYPLSEEFRDPASGLTVQYFERQRLEYHPDNPPGWQVEGGLLGRQLLPAHR